MTENVVKLELKFINEMKKKLKQKRSRNKVGDKIWED